MNIPFERSFASHEKSKYWSSRNTEKPENVFKNSHKRFWFECDCGHTFDAQLDSINNGSWCPYCSHNKLCNETSCLSCYNKSIASHEKSKYWSSRNTEQPRNVFKSSDKKFWFDCDCGHTFDSALSSINNGQWCSYCSNPPKKICNETSCLSCYNKSFASHEKSKYWSSRNTEQPIKVFKSSHKKFWFDCDCGHTFDSALSSINNGSWCSYCSNPPQTLCNKTDCDFCYNNSFASHEKSKYWSNQNIKNPRNVFKSSHKKFWFDCDCGHTFDSALSNINNGQWCPYCANKKLCNESSCLSCYNNSFASHEKSKYWSNQNIKNPRNVFKCSDKKFSFDSDCGHTFESVLSSITCCGSWCPYCVNKTETKLYEKISQIYPTLERQFKQDWCKKIKHLPYDFCIPEHKIIIELDGRQHFQQVSNWCSPDEQFENDKFKEECANQNDYSVIRLLQEDVWYDRYDWVQKLYKRIEEIKINNENNQITNIYLSEHDEYEQF
jgi:very-short-patch-repair endonuclease